MIVEVHGRWRFKEIFVDDIEMMNNGLSLYEVIGDEDLLYNTFWTVYRSPWEVEIQI